jgi:hypothetical protein
MGFGLTFRDVLHHENRWSRESGAVARGHQFLRHCATCATPILKREVAHWRTPRLARGRRPRPNGTGHGCA